MVREALASGVAYCQEEPSHWKSIQCQWLLLATRAPPVEWRTPFHRSSMSWARRRVVEGVVVEEEADNQRSVSSTKAVQATVRG